MSRGKRWLGAAFVFVAGDAMAMQARGPLLSSFESTYRVGEGLLGLVAPAGTVGFVLAILAFGLLAGRLNVRATMLAGTAAMAASMLAVAVAPTYSLLLLALLAQGAAAGVFRALDRPVLSHVYPDRIGRIFVLYSLAWALGAVTGPLLVTAAIAVASWRATYLLFALWFVPVLVLLRGLEPPGWDEAELDRAALVELVRRPAIAGTLVGMALVGGVEGAIFTWLPYYAGTFLNRSLANAALSAYLLAYVPGRYLYSRLVDRGGYLRIAFATTALAIPAVAAALVGTRGPAMLVAVFAAGLVLSSLFPLLSAYGVEAAPAYSGPVSALSTAATYVGIAVVPTVMGLVAERGSIAEAMWLPVGLTVALLGVVAVMGIASSRSTSRVT